MKIHGINPAVVAAYARAPRESGQAPTSASKAFTLDRAAPGQPHQEVNGMAKLVAGRVPSGINRGEGFDQIPPPGGARQTLQLYSNNAERVEAATRVAVGRILDTTA